MCYNDLTTIYNLEIWISVVFKNQRSAFAVASFPVVFLQHPEHTPYLLPHLHPNIFVLIYDSPLFA